VTRLELRGLRKRFDDVDAVANLDLTVEPGTLMAFLGPSGCGKTTTLRMIAGLERPSGGDILFDGESILGVPAERRNIGMVFQRYVLFPHMNVARNVSFGLRMRGVDRAEIEARVAEVLDVVQLTGLERRFPSQLSGGQQQRVAIARTVVTRPRLLLMDEPLANLDAKLREEMRAFITELQRRLGITTIFVTHDQVEAIELADRIGVMFGGALVQVGSPEEVFNRPRSLAVAEFMGTTNQLRGHLLPSGLLRTAAGDLAIAPAPHHRQGDPVVATVRPEHVDLLPPEGDGLRGRIRGSVYYGGTLTYRVALAGGDTTLAVRERSTRRLADDAEVSVRIEPHHLWICPEP
jgi:putative spermidine/putrescine transport system ATP-binding protein